MKEISLDRLDYKIIKVLEADGRISNVELSKQVNLSQSQCLRRIRKLEEDGIISGYRAEIDYEKLGYSVIAWVMVTVNSNNLGARDKVITFLQNESCISSVSGVTGDIDLIVEICAKSMTEFTEVIVKRLYNHPEVVSTKSYIRLDIAKIRGLAVPY